MARICVFGDSIAWGSWDPDGGGWVGRLQREGCRREDLLGGYHGVYNLSIPGDRLHDLAERFEAEAGIRRPAAIVLAIGINDVPHSGFGGTPINVFEKQFTDLLRVATSIAIDVAVVTPTNVDEARSEHDYRNDDISSLVDVMNRAATLFRVPVANVFGLLDSTDLEPDGIHPGARGHQKLYEHISPVVFGLPSLRTRT
jgi:acyl-CoA thioesterase-1